MLGVGGGGGKGFEDPEEQWGDVPWAGEERISDAAHCGKSKTHYRRNSGVLGTQPDNDATFFMVMTQTVPGGQVSGNQETKGLASVFLATSFLVLGSFWEEGQCQ